MLICFLPESVRISCVFCSHQSIQKRLTPGSKLIRGTGGPAARTPKRSRTGLGLEVVGSAFGSQANNEKGATTHTLAKCAALVDVRCTAAPFALNYWDTFCEKKKTLKKYML